METLLTDSDWRVCLKSLIDRRHQLENVIGDSDERLGCSADKYLQRPSLGVKRRRLLLPPCRIPAATTVATERLPPAKATGSTAAHTALACSATALPAKEMTKVQSCETAVAAQETAQPTAQVNDCDTSTTAATTTAAATPSSIAATTAAAIPAATTANATAASPSGATTIAATIAVKIAAAATAASGTAKAKAPLHNSHLATGVSAEQAFLQAG